VCSPSLAISLPFLPAFPSPPPQSLLAPTARVQFPTPSSSIDDGLLCPSRCRTLILPRPVLTAQSSLPPCFSFCSPLSTSPTPTGTFDFLVVENPRGRFPPRTQRCSLFCSPPRFTLPSDCRRKVEEFCSSFSFTEFVFDDLPSF